MLSKKFYFYVSSSSSDLLFYVHTSNKGDDMTHARLGPQHVCGTYRVADVGSDRSLAEQEATCSHVLGPEKYLKNNLTLLTRLI